MASKVAIVTGASQGMGRSTAVRLARDFDSIAVTPMATPLITGPGAMTVTMVYMHDAAGLDVVWILAAILIAMVGSWIIVVNSDLLYSFIHKDGTRVLTKVMGIVLAAIATGMMLQGISNSFPALLHGVV